MRKYTLKELRKLVRLGMAHDLTNAIVTCFGFPEGVTM